MLVSECNRNLEAGENMSTIAIGAVDQQLTELCERLYPAYFEQRARRRAS